MARTFPNICSDRLAASRDFYTALFRWSVAFDSDWYVQLADGEGGDAVLGIMRRDHELVPPSFRELPRGAFLTVVVDDADVAHRRALEQGAAIVEPPRDLFYGQRRLLLTDPNGFLLDVSAPTAPLSAEPLVGDATS